MQYGDNETIRRDNNTTVRRRRLYRRWVKYLSDSRLSNEDIRHRAASAAARGEPVPTE